MKYLVFAVNIYLIVASVQGAEDMFHISCEGTELKVSGPVTELHVECSKNLDPEAEKNLCEMQCIRQKEGMFGPDGKPSLEKHLMYTEKFIEKGLQEKVKMVVKSCFEQHAASIQPHDSDKSCATSKAFNSCMKTAMMGICNSKA